MRVIRLEETSSTNDYLRSYLGGGEDMIVCARRQTGGRGTKGRTFLSEEGGVYLSALTFYAALPVADAFSIMTHAAVAVCLTAEEYGVRPQIKWPNDIYADGRKLCGILIENTLSGGWVRASIVGIGLNVSNDVSALGGTAVTLRELAQRPLDAEDVRRSLIANLLRETTLKEYLARVGFLGQTVTVLEGEESYPATARRILPDGRLEIETASGRRALSAAEISIRV